MDDADAALLRQRDRHARFRHRIHGGTHDGDSEREVARETGLGVGIRGYYIGAGGQQHHIIEREGLGDGEVDHFFLCNDSRVRLRGWQTGSAQELMLRRQASMHHDSVRYAGVKFFWQ